MISSGSPSMCGMFRKSHPLFPGFTLSVSLTTIDEKSYFCILLCDRTQREGNGWRTLLGCSPIPNGLFFG